MESKLLHEIQDRYEVFAKENTLDFEAFDNPSDFEKYLRAGPIHEFLGYLCFEDPRRPPGEEESFLNYSDYRFAKKKCMPLKELRESVTRKWHHLYNKKGFKNLLSRKSIQYLKQWIYFRMKNIHVIAYGSGYEYGEIKINFFALEEIQTRKGPAYFHRNPKEWERDDDFDIVIMGHVFDRYAERDDISFKDRAGLIETFMRNEFNLLDRFTVTARSSVATDNVEGVKESIKDLKRGYHHCSAPTENGMMLGHFIKELRLFKTYVGADKLGDNQIQSAVVHLLYKDKKEGRSVVEFNPLPN